MWVNIWWGQSKEDRVRVLSIAQCNARGSEHKVKHRKFHLNTRKTVFLQRWSNTCTGYPERLWRLHLWRYSKYWVLETQLDTALDTPLQMHLLWVEGGMMTRGALQVQVLSCGRDLGLCCLLSTFPGPDSLSLRPKYSRSDEWILYWAVL